MQYIWKSALGAAIALSLSTSASAEVKSVVQTSLSGLTFSVQDLTPDDGRAAGFTFGERATNYYVINEGGMNNMIAADPVVPTPVDWALEYAPGVSMLNTDGSLGTYTSTVRANTRTRDIYGYDLSASGWDAQKIVLKAGSALTVSGLATASIDQYVPAIMEHGGSYSLASARLTYVLGGAAFQSFERELRPGGGVLHESYSDEFSLYAVNSGDVDVEFNLEMIAYARYNGWDRTPFEEPAPVPTPLPVPEPSTWLMMAVGVVALAGRAWSKSRRA